MENLDTPGKRIRRLYQDLELNQTELAHRLRGVGVSITNAYISELVNTDKYPSPKVAKGFATVLGSSLDYIYCFSEIAHPPSVEHESGAVLREGQLLYEAADPSERLLTSKMLKTWDKLTDAERTVVIDLADALPKLRARNDRSDHQNGRPTNNNN